jgi:hypothetical protein|tara:strand:- start:8306 stop:9019 length:714 start_codon:yes stop_codon:yes gene_type:complete
MVIYENKKYMKNIDKIKVFHYGCSFTQNVGGFASDEFNEFEYVNLGKQSSSNKSILDTFKTTYEPNSTAIIQWSSLTRPNDANSILLDTSDNPLYDLLDEWYEFISDAILLSRENNIKLIHYIGWAIWKDSELNEYHRDKLKSYNINWFKSNKQLDLPTSNCYQFQSPDKWSSAETNSDGLYQWPELIWGGMSEWIRENVNITDRYIGLDHGGDGFDPHPSEYATIQFVKQVIIPLI